MKKGSSSRSAIVRGLFLTASLVVLDALPTLPASAAPPGSSATFLELHSSRHVPLVEGDRLVLGVGFSDAFRLLEPAPSRGWREVAALSIEGVDAYRWTGYTCLTGTGRYAGAVFAPTTFTNDQTLRDRGAFGATVDLETGRVWLVPERVALKYHSPGCGVGDEIVFARSLGQDQAATEFLRIDPAAREVLDQRITTGPLTFGVPVDGGVAAAAGGSVVRVDPAGGLSTLASVDGRVIDVHPSANGGLDFLAAHVGHQRLVAKRWTPGGGVSTLGSGDFGAFRIAAGRNGENRLVGRPSTSTARSLEFLASDRVAPAVSLDGSLLVASVDYESANALDLGDAVRIRAVVPRSARSVTTRINSSRLRPLFPSASSPVIGRAVNVSNPKCSIVPVDYKLQVRQTNAKQVEWAANRAVRGQLTIGRPANWNGNGLTQYTPQTVFPRRWTTDRIPVQVLEGVLAQESNLSQASWHALDGGASDPLIADYYGRVLGANGYIVGMNFDGADCGYGIAQITDNMAVSDTAYTNAQKTMIATDYEANIAVAVQILEKKWDETRGAPFNLVANGGNVAKIENWYFAVWAYNSGVHYQTQTDSHYGVGWSNNPANADYPIDRLPFLRYDSADAAHPADWPYQEKVMGWAETPQLNENGNPSYAPSPNVLYLPSNSFLFCDASNDCDPNHHNGNLSYCALPSRECWWHNAVTWWPSSVTGTTENTAGYVSGAPEPTAANPWQPDCDGSKAVLPLTNLTTLPTRAVIVDDLPNRSWNIVGCSAKANPGTFNLSFATDPTTGAKLSKIDFHQIGAGYGGHFWFAHTVTPSRTNMYVTGRWTPPSTTKNWTRIMVYIPEVGADTYQATYTVNSGTKTVDRVVNQRWNRNLWFDLGRFNLSAGARVTLTNAAPDGGLPGEIDLAYDAVAFIPANSNSVVDYVALGDSYSAGEGLEPYYRNADVGRGGFRTNACHRSSRAYPMLVFNQLVTENPGPSEFHFLACSGAVIRDLESDQHFYELPQLAQGYLDNSTTHVTVGISGNDAGFSEVLKDCFLSWHYCIASDYYLNRNGTVDPEPLIDWEPKLIQSLEPRVEALIDRVKTLAPNATILMFGYPHIMTTRCPEYTNDQVNWFAAMADLLNRQIEIAAQNRGVLFANPVNAFLGHEACASDEWINHIIAWSDSGSGFKTPGSGSFHPEAIGHQADRDVIMARLP